jgi:hypothetical protein
MPSFCIIQNDDTNKLIYDKNDEDEPFFVYYLDTSLKTVMLEEKNLSRKKSPAAERERKGE